MNDCEPQHRDEQDPEPDFALRIRAARDGDSSAMAKLLAECRPYLLAIANSELPSDILGKVGASDVVQDTMLSAQRCIKGFGGDDREALLAWLRAILVNDLRGVQRYYRRDKRDVSRELPLASNSRLGGDRIRAGQTPSGLAVEKEQRQRLHRAMRELTEDERRVIELRTWQRLPFAEIGVLLDGRSAEAARKLWARAVMHLQASMRDFDD